jgi:drug/metabolite transporter (DMT)-like permease
MERQLVNPDPTWGIVAAIVSTTLWAFSSVAFEGELQRYGALAMNLFKGTLAGVLFWVTFLVCRQVGLFDVPEKAVFWPLFLSGVVGMSFGDFAYFTAIHRCGVQKATLLHGTAPIFLVVAAFVTGLHAPLLLELGGILLVVAGVTFVTAWRGKRREDPTPLSGIAWGLLAALGQAGGILIAKDALQHTHFVYGAACRLTGAAVGLALPLVLVGRHRFVIGTMTDGTIWRRISHLVVLGSFIGVGAMTVAIDGAKPAVSGALLSLTPVMVIPFSVLLAKKSVTWPQVLGTAIAVAGVILVSVASRGDEVA